MPKKRPSSTVVISVPEMARMYERSQTWARRILTSWLEEQEAGGEVRVFKRRDLRGRVILETTRAVLHRHAPPARDMQLVRAVERIDKDVDFLARRLNALVSRFEQLEKLFAKTGGRR